MSPVAKINKIRSRLVVLIGNDRLKKAHQYFTTVIFARSYALAGLAVLVTTTTFWAALGAKLQQNNADQLVNPYLFQTDATFHDALIPSAHSFLIKWPLFWLIKVFGFSSSAYINMTIAVVLLTVVGLAAVLYIIDHRPLVFGTVCLALASVLLLIPTNPTGDALLPVNMAMLATRNLEYLFFVGSLVLLTKNFRIRSWSFWLSVVVLGLLVASDKLFLTLTLGGALLGLVIYGLSSGWNLVSLSARWTIAGLSAGAAAIGLLWWINMKAFTHITTQSSVSPYHLISNAKQLVLGAIYGGLALLTNFGANPASQTTVLRQVPRQAASNMLSANGPAYIINLLILLFGLWAAFMIVKVSLAHNKDRAVILSYPTRLSLTLVWSSLAAVIAFIVTDHYFAADARYLTVVLFALFIAAVTYFSQKQWSPERLLGAGLIMTVGIALSLPHLITTYHHSQSAFTPAKKRNDLVIQALAHHKVDTLVGDYWRVIPAKNSTGGKMKIMPLENCTTPRSTLSSREWQLDLNNHSFAYLLTLDGSLTDFSNCTIDGVVAAYGRPNGSILINGTISKPKEILLFYDKGANHSAPIAKLNTPSTILPVELEDLPQTTCKGPSIMNIVAHEDDDLLFMNPDLLHDIQAGHCVRTIYLTAGDSGAGYFYWLTREHGSEAAYARMLNFDDIWIERIVHLADNEYVTIASPRGNGGRVSLIYMHLPDGNMRGQGFGSDKFQSLASLDANKITSMDAIYGGSTFTSAQLVHSLTQFMQTYQPTEIRTQSTYAGGGLYNDHSDHNTVGRIATKAYQAYEQEHFENKIMIPLTYYLGYTGHQFAPNVVGADLDAKEAIFHEYSQYDGAVCHSIAQCRHDPAYGIYLPRQYTHPN